MGNETTQLLAKHLRTLSAAARAENVPDGELLQRFAAQRDEEAFATLVRRHGPMVLRVCQRVLHDVHAAEDAFQATFLVLSRKAASLRRADSVGCWLQSVAYRLALKARTQRTRQRRPDVRGTVKKPIDDPLARLTVREAQAIVDEELTHLPEKYRSPLVLCYLEGKTRDEAARQLGWSAKLVKSRLEQGRERLRYRLCRRGLTLPAALVATLLVEEAAPAALPATLLLRAAVQTAIASPAPSIPPSVALLAEGALRGTATVKAKIVAGLLLLMGILAAGVGAYAPPQPAEQQAEVPSLAKAAGTPKAEKPSAARTDHFGDRLPPGAVTRLGTVRFRHGAPIYTVAVSPDGRIIASGSFDRTVRLWSAGTGKKLHVCQGHRDRITSVSFAPDGKRLASASYDKSVRLWETSTGKFLRQLEGHSDLVTCVVFSPDGKALASASYDKTVRLWDAATGEQLRQLRGHEKPVNALAFSADSQRLLSGGWDRTIRLWDLSSGNEVRRFEGHGCEVNCLALPPDGKALAFGGHHPGLDRKGHEPIYLFDMETGKELRQLAGHGGGLNANINAVAFSLDGKTLTSAANDGTIRLWDAATGKEIPRYKAAQCWCVTCLAFSPDGNILVSGGHDDAIRLWETATGKEITSGEAPQGRIQSLAISPDGKTLVSSSDDRTIRFWDLASGKELRRLTRRSGQISTIAFSPDGKTLACACGDEFFAGKDNGVRLWDVSSGGEIGRLGDPNIPINVVVYSPDGKTLAWGDNFNTIRLWDIAARKEIIQLRSALADNVYALAFSPDGKRLISAGGDAIVHVWDVAAGKELRQLAGHGNIILSAVLSPGGDMVASASRDGTIRLWQLATGKIHRLFRGGPQGFHAVAFSPDGKTLASGEDGEGSVKLWEVASGKVRGEFRGHKGGVRALVFADGGTRLISGSDDTTILVWDVTGWGEEGKPRASRLSDKQREALWADLASADAGKAYRAIWTLTTAPAQSVSWLGERLSHTAPPANPEQMVRLITDLDSDRFAVREKAAQELEDVAEWAEPDLRKALEGRPPLETRKRIERLLEKLEGAIISPTMLRELRAIEALEHSGSSEAKRILKIMAQKTPGLRMTQEAKSALDRLTHRSATQP